MLDKTLLEKLLSTHSPSGYELNIQKLLIKELSDVSEGIITNQNYNLINYINKDAKTKILLLTHIDEIGLVINKIYDNGTCRVENIGAIRPHMYAGQHVKVLNNGKEIPGVFGYTPNMDNLKTTNLILDLGTNSKEETQKLVEIGCPVIVDRTYTYLANNHLAAKALDDKLAVYIGAEVLKRCKNKTNHGIYLASTVGEETTGRGASASVQQVKPTCCICIDVTYASDINYRENLTNDVSLGKGVCLTEGSLMNKLLHKRFKEICQNKNIPYQMEVAPSRTYTDSDSVFNYFTSTPTYLISIPLRYMHSSVEVCNLDDVENIINLITEFVLTLEDNFNLNPFNE